MNRAPRAADHHPPAPGAVYLFLPRSPDTTVPAGGERVCYHAPAWANQPIPFSMTRDRAPQGENVKRLPVALITLSCLFAMTIPPSAAERKPVPHRHLNLAARSDKLPYSHAVLVGDTLYLAGSIGLDPATGAPPADVREEARIVLNGMKKRLALAGMTMDDLVSVQIFCSDLSLYDDFNSIYRTYFEAGFPARAFVGSGPLLHGGHFEIMGVAVRRSSH
ncbi:MAG: RidA family protein [Acidobacteriota bacterium]